MKLVFLHGWGSSPSIWDALRKELTEFDSTAPSLQAPESSLADWANALAPNLPDAALVVGWSLGSQLALALAEQHPHKVRGLFLVGASPKFVASQDWPAGLDIQTVEGFIAAFKLHPVKILKRFLALQVLGDSHRHDLAPLLEFAQTDQTIDSSLGNGLALLKQNDLRAQKLDSALPIRLVHGKHDALMPLAAAQWLANRYPNSRLEVIEGAGHAPLFTQPEKLAKRLREFVSEC